MSGNIQKHLTIRFKKIYFIMLSIVKTPIKINKINIYEISR